MGPLLLLLVAIGCCASATAPPRRQEINGAIRLGPLPCADPSCPTAGGGRPLVNNSDFHLRDIQIMRAGDGYYYLTGTSNSAGDKYWSDTDAVVSMWRPPRVTMTFGSQSPLLPGLKRLIHLPAVRPPPVSNASSACPRRSTTR